MKKATGAIVVGLVCYGLSIFLSDWGHIISVG
jgi:hypothetical protein